MPANDAYPACFRGVTVPMVTPYLPDDISRIDHAVLEQFTDYLCGSGVSALFPASGMGQWMHLTLAEKKAMLDTVIRASAGRKPVFAGIGSSVGYEETYEMMAYGEKAGAVASFSVTPPSWERSEATGLFVDQEEVFRYYQSVDERAQLPFAVYDFFAAISIKTAERLSHLPNFKGMKYRTTDALAMLRMLKAVDGRVAPSTGVEHVTLPALACGYVGVVGGGPNVIADLVVDLVEAFHRGDLNRARELQHIVCEANDRFEDLGGGGFGSKLVLSEIIGVPIAVSQRRNFTEAEPLPDIDPQVRQRALDYYRSLDLRAYNP
jgi:dihydrodipicolinate synthase/N-acetylneuraminate lyase